MSRSVILTWESTELMVCMAAVISEFLKKSLISERKGVILYIDMALSYFLVVYKITHFLAIMQEPCLFSILLSLKTSTCET